MSISLQRFNSGDTNYVAKHNSNADVLEAAVKGLESQVAGAFGGAISIGEALRALFGASAALIGAASYQPSASGSSLAVTAGFAWLASQSIVVRSVSTKSVSFSGAGAATYYLTADATGNPIRSTNITDALYSVVWTGASFGTITRLAPVVWGAADQVAAQASAALGASYDRLDERLEAGEAKAVAGDSARAAQTGKLTKSVAGGADVTLTATESNFGVIEFTGSLTADITVTLASSQVRTWLLINSTSGGRVLTAKVGGAGIKLPAGSSFAYHSGSALLSAGLRPYRPAAVTLAYTPSLVADFAAADVVRVTLAGNAAITLAGAADGQKCVLEVTQDASGGWTLSFGSEIRLGTDLTVLTLSTTPGKTDRIGFIFDAASGTYDAVAIMRGF